MTIAHAADWVSGGLYTAPLVIIVLVLLRAKIRERREGAEPTADDPDVDDR